MVSLWSGAHVHYDRCPPLGKPFLDLMLSSGGVGPFPCRRNWYRAGCQDLLRRPEAAGWRRSGLVGRGYSPRARSGARNDWEVVGHHYDLRAAMEGAARRPVTMFGTRGRSSVAPIGICRGCITADVAGHAFGRFSRAMAPAMDR